MSHDDFGAVPTGGPKKRVDEDWKRRVEKEKGKLAEEIEEKKDAPAEADPRFLVFLSSLVAEIQIFLGLVAHPSTGTTMPDLDRAQYLIEVLRMLQEKTKGNLAAEEEKELSAVIYELQMRYVSAIKERDNPPRQS